MTPEEQQKQRERQEAIREGIRLERSRVIAMLFSGEWKNEPCQDAAGLIMNGMHWQLSNGGIDDACR